MAQSDYELAAHISGLNQRTEINSIFDSILTHNSGSTAPTVTKAFMMWVDTSNATYYYLKMRNHDNTAWVTLFIYTVSTKVITPFIINSPTTNALSKINADGTIGNSNIINDTNGNVGIGVIPKPWFGSYTKAIELGSSSDGGTIWSSLNQNVSHIGIGANFYYDSAFTPRYKANGPANEYYQQNGFHRWQTAPSGTAGSAITWTNAMTLDASGNLLLQSGTGGLGYGTGAGGTVTQLTSKSTAVTLNKPTGTITMNNAALASGATIGFTFNNNLVTQNDTINANINGGITGHDNYTVKCSIFGNGLIAVYVRNDFTSSLSESVQIKFNIIKGANT